jgi:hypothetical protein
MGRIPVFLYDDLPWDPYRYTNISVRTYGYIGSLWNHSEGLTTVVEQLHNATESEIAAKYEKLKEVRHWFTYKGVMHQIQLFLSNPLHEGHLRCLNFDYGSTHPRTERCCG